MKAITKIFIESFCNSTNLQALHKELIKLHCAIDFLVDENDSKLRAIDKCLYLVDTLIDDRKEGEEDEE